MARVTEKALVIAVAGACLAVTTIDAQTPTMPSTLRYGSGLMDIPVSSVLPHLNVTATYSGFFAGLARRVEIDEAGGVSGSGPGRDEFLADGSVAIGLFERAEMGLTFQSFQAADEGGKQWGVFGRVRLWEPVDQGLGVAVGGRYVTSPTFGDGVAYAPGRLGFADDRVRKSYAAFGGFGTNTTLYAVATAYLRGFDGGPLPENDMTFSLGYGGGMFKDGGELDFYAPGHANGWFFGTALHIGMGQRSQLTLMAEHNGFDVNVGAHYDWEGLRVGAQYLAGNHAWPSGGQTSEYETPKFGLLASVAICPLERGFRCKPSGMRRVEPDTVYLPPPPPDTVVIRTQTQVAVVPEGVAASVCLSTGQNVPIRVTAVGDTLVGEPPVALRALGPGLEFAGTYAGNAFWYQDREVVIFEGGDFRQSEDVFPIDCNQILRVGVHQGVPVFAVITAQRPLDVIFIPVRPGLWHRYERGYSPNPEDG